MPTGEAVESCRNTRIPIKNPALVLSDVVHVESSITIAVRMVS